MRGRSFEPRNVPYVKLHGDLQARSLTVLTQEEIDTAKYDSAMLLLAKQILRSHHVIFPATRGMIQRSPAYLRFPS